MSLAICVRFSSRFPSDAQRGSYDTYASIPFSCCTAALRSPYDFIITRQVRDIKPLIKPTTNSQLPRNFRISPQPLDQSVINRIPLICFSGSEP